MSENTTQEKGLFETLADRAPEIQTQGNSKTSSHENVFGFCEEDHKFEFLVQDMFLDHFFP